jgi:two-component system sensor histidine kinase PilS (NtrC family)
MLSKTSKAAHRFETTIAPKVKTNDLYLGVSVSLLRDNHQKISGLIFIFQDLTELRVMQEQVARADRLAAIGQLAAGVAHEIRNPLASISGAVQMLKTAELDVSEDNAALMEIVLRESSRLDTILTDFLLYARPKTITFGKHDLLHEVVFSTIGLLKQDPRFTAQSFDIQIGSAPNFPKIVCDVQQIQQVFWNLFLNAFQAMKDGGVLSIEAQVKKVESWELSTQTPIYAAVFSIHDTGEGISEEHLRHIFHPFYTTKRRGTGLGLAIVHSIIENHHGTVKVMSSEHQGTTFEIILPLTQEHW